MVAGGAFSTRWSSRCWNPCRAAASRPQVPAGGHDARPRPRCDAAPVRGARDALRALLATEQDRGPDFLRLARALSALYPKDSEEKRLLDAMLLAVPR